MRKQGIDKNKNFKISLYCTITLIVISILLPVSMMHDVMKEILASKDELLISGQADVWDYDFLTNESLALKGEWYVYENLYFNEETLPSDRLANGNLTHLPISNLNNARGTCTYQGFVRFQLPSDNPDRLVLSLPFVDESVSVYLNGIRLESNGAFSDIANSRDSLTFYNVSSAYNSSEFFQNIVISTNENPENTQLFNRVISLSTKQILLTEQSIIYLIQGILLGAMILIVVVAVMFMGLMPSYSALTFMNLFDITLMTHLIFSTSILPRLFFSTFLPTGYGDIYFKRLDLFFLMVAGALGNELAMIIWDPHKIAPKMFRKPTIILYGMTALFVVFFPFHVNFIVVIWMVLLLVWTFIGVVITFVMNHKQGYIDLYRTLHFIKTIYLGLIILLDIITINFYDRPVNQIAIGYSIFLLVHLLIRAYEYKLPYIEMRNLNNSLEVIVADRTSELVKANEVLRTINERDALTNAYNRLYFEEEILQGLESFKQKNSAISSMYLCIFDLDNFKSINDTYGHLVGDEQLIEAVKLTKEIVGDEAKLSRIGGEEFTLLFLNKTDDQVLSTAEDVRKSLEMQSHNDGRTTGSFGICKATKDLNRKGIFSKADDCLYEAKTTGKNKIIYNFDGARKTYI